MFLREIDWFMVTPSFLGATVQEADDYPMAHHRPVTLVIPSLGNIAWGNRIMAPKEIDLESEPQEAQVWDDYYVKNTTWQKWLKHARKISGNGHSAKRETDPNRSTPG